MLRSQTKPNHQAAKEEKQRSKQENPHQKSACARKLQRAKKKCAETNDEAIKDVRKRNILRKTIEGSREREECILGYIER
jgi:hypothetical protein